MVGALWRWWNTWFKGEAVEDLDVTVGTTTGGGEEPINWIPVYVAANRLEAEVVRGRLESEGIPAMLRGEALGSVYGFTHGPLAQVEVLVPETLLDRAERALDAPAEDTEEA